MTPRATYRLQFLKGFPFARATELADYFAALGISHIYASPILAARAGSTHGYNVIDFGRVNPELGGEDEFRRMAAALRARDIGIIADIVPNHMAVGKDDNPWWLDVLKNGEASAYAAYFDIAWDALGGKILAPFLDGSPEQVLTKGDLKIMRDDRGAAFAYFDNRFPLRQADDARLSGTDIAALTIDEKMELLAQQHYILADWREANARINWRRFFDITELAGLRMENDATFDAVHAKTFALYAEGLIDGLRVDHIDGLSDPHAYCRKLRSCLEGARPAGTRERRAYLIVEKILAPNEALPTDWGVDGTTGYDFMEDVSALLHRCDGDGLSQLWTSVSGRSADFDIEEVAARKELLERNFAAQWDATSLAFTIVTAADGVRSDLSRVLAQLRCYRTYATAKTDTPSPGACFEAAVAASDSASSPIDTVMHDASGRPEAIDAIRRFNQLAAPIAAKAVEDTAFYRYGRLLSRNDVGSDPRLHGLSVADFHRRTIERAKSFPHAVLTTATHDHKRGEDARARLAVLSEIPDLWTKKAEAWLSLAPSTLDRSDVYQLLQTIVGAWPPEENPDLEALSTRIQVWCRKFLREAKLRSSWTSPAMDYENAFVSFASTLLRNAEFTRSAFGLVGHFAPAAVANSLAQTVLRLTLPGVPDLYQGREGWDFSLVDPDNRRPVDFERLKTTLSQSRPLDPHSETWRDGRSKQALIARLLNARRLHADLFVDGAYEPIAIKGERAAHVIAFRRVSGLRHAIIAVALHCTPSLIGGEKIVPPQDWWANTTLAIECAGTMRDALRDVGFAGVPTNVGALFQSLPVAVLISADRET